MLEVALMLIISITLFLAIIDIFILLRARSVLQREAILLAENPDLLKTSTFPSTQKKIVPHLNKIISIDGISCLSTQAPQPCCNYSSSRCLTIEVLPNQEVLDRPLSQNFTTASVILTYHCSLWILDKWTKWTSYSKVSNNPIAPVSVEKKITQTTSESPMTPPVIESYRGIS